jgi:hypothetical protein
MRVNFLACMIFAILALTGCGGGSTDVAVAINPPPFVASVLSDPLLDGDIEVGAGITTIRQGNTLSVYVGIDPVTLSETRAFLDFPLASIPGNAIINSATLDMVVDSLQPSGALVPILVDLVSYPQPLLAVDFGGTFLATTTITPAITSLDIGNHVTVNVTALMQEAQRRGLAHFQVRLLQGPGGTATGLVQINDTTGVNRPAHAPLLTVVYF